MTEEYKNCLQKRDKILEDLKNKYAKRNELNNLIAEMENEYRRADNELTDARNASIKKRIKT